jgi:hypothetical protein
MRGLFGPISLAVTLWASTATADALTPPPAPPTDEVQASRVGVWATLGPKIVLQGGTALPVFGAGPEINLLDVAPLHIAVWIPINFWFVSQSVDGVGGTESVTVYGYELVPQIRANVRLHPLVDLVIDFGGGPVLVVDTTSGTFIGSSSQTQGAGVIRFAAAVKVNATPHFSLFLQPFGLDIYFGNTLKNQSLQMYSLMVGAGYRF